MIARCLALLALIVALPAAASETVLTRLAEPDVHAIMRHALAPGYSDPANFDVEDCRTQRNLDARGRDQARRAGEMIRTAGVQVDEVWSSRWCRCLDTAREMRLGPVREVEALNSFFENRSDGPRQTEELMALLDAIPAERTVLLVSHQVNISALLGTATGSGEIVVFRYRDGVAEILGRVTVPIARP
jgi:phosphohistidine phosphatase SixA